MNATQGKATAVVMGKTEGDENKILLTGQYGQVQIKHHPKSITLDCLGRMRVGQITTLADLKTLNTDDPLLLENVGTGTGAWADNKFTLSVTAGQYYIRRSRRYYPYFSGKSQGIEFTMDGFQPEAGVTKRRGYFSSNASAPYNSNLDGLALESAPDGVYLKVWRNGTETLSVRQDQWNEDSISDYDWSKFTSIHVDYLWLGGAILRLFVKRDTGFVLCHTFNYAGNQTDIFMLSPNHTVRDEIRSTTGSGSFRSICSTVFTEGSIDECGKIHSVNTGSASISLPAIGTTYAVLGVRKRAGYRDVPIHLHTYNAFVTSADEILISVQINPTISGTPTWNNLANAAIQYAVGTGAGLTLSSPGTVIDSRPIAQSSIMPAGLLDKDFLSWLGMTIQDVSDEIWVCGTPLSVGVNAYAGMPIKQF